MLAELANWKDFENVESKVAILPIGSFEQHGPHLPVTADVIVAYHIARSVEKKLKNSVVVFPPVIYTCSREHTGFPGTVWVGYGTFINYVKFIARGIHRMGFGDILVINGHGGNVEVLGILQRSLNLRNTGLRLHLINTLNYRLVREVFQERELNHADFVESSMIAAIDKNLVELEQLKKLRKEDFKLKNKDVFTLVSTRKATAHGIVETGEPFYDVDTKKGRKLLGLLIEQTIEKTLDAVRNRKSHKA